MAPGATLSSFEHDGGSYVKNSVSLKVYNPINKYCIRNREVALGGRPDDFSIL